MNALRACADAHQWKKKEKEKKRPVGWRWWTQACGSATDALRVRKNVYEWRKKRHLLMDEDVHAGT